MDRPLHDASVNLMGLLNVLEASAAAGVRKVVFASSGGTIYGQPRSLPIKETARKGSRPDSPYGVSKKTAEDYLRFYHRYRGVDYTALALANVYGPRQDPQGEAGVVGIFGSQMLAGERPTIFGDGNQTRDYVFIDDTVHAFALAAERASGALLNVGTGLETSVNGIYRLMAQITGYKGQPQIDQPRRGEVLRSALDIGLAESELGWKPWTTLEDGLRETVFWLRDARS
jgi:UDP-glucose 4-epimerase